MDYDRIEATRSLVLSYLGIRRAIGLLGAFLPILLGPFGYFVLDIPIQRNMSSYYYTSLRDVFVGIMCSIGVFLFCYRGHSHLERWNGLVGCAAAMGIAFFPLDPNSDPLRQDTIMGYLHTLCGGLFFMSLAVYSLVYFPASCDESLAPLQLNRCNFIFRLSGLTLLVSMAAMGVYLFLLPPTVRDELTELQFLFWMEWIAVWAFAAAWLAKGRILSLDFLDWDWRKMIEQRARELFQQQKKRKPKSSGD